RGRGRTHPVVLAVVLGAGVVGAVDRVVDLDGAAGGQVDQIVVAAARGQRRVGRVNVFHRAQPVDVVGAATCRVGRERVALVARSGPALVAQEVVVVAGADLRHRRAE